MLDTPQYRGKIALTGLGTPLSLKKFVNDGTINAFELWNPANLGYLAAYAAVNLASGKITGAAGPEVLGAGKLGSYTVGPDHTSCWDRRRCSQRRTSASSTSRPSLQSHRGFGSAGHRVPREPPRFLSPYLTCRVDPAAPGATTTGRAGAALLGTPARRSPACRRSSDVSLDLFAGETHALVGENGAGKSTLIKILGGVHQPDAGTLVIGGDTVFLTGPAEATHRGVAVIYQEPTLFPDLSVAENVFIGRQPLQVRSADRSPRDERRGHARSSRASASSSIPIGSRGVCRSPSSSSSRSPRR